MTTDNSPAAHRTAAPNLAYGAMDERPAQLPVRRGDETKSAFKTTEFIASAVAVAGDLVTSFLVSTTDAHEDYFRAC